MVCSVDLVAFAAHPSTKFAPDTHVDTLSLERCRPESRAPCRQRTARPCGGLINDARRPRGPAAAAAAAVRTKIQIKCQVFLPTSSPIRDFPCFSLTYFFLVLSFLLPQPLHFLGIAAMGAVASRSAGEGDAAANPRESSPAPLANRDFETLRREELVLEAAANPPEDIPSCLTLFDKWLTCYALGEQFRSVYRYGTIANCAPRREDFKFCLTLRQYDPETRRAKWLERRAEASAHQRKGVRTSEAVWEMRRDPLMDPAFVDPSYPLPSCTYPC